MGRHASGRQSRIAQIAAERRALVDWRANGAGVASELLDAAGTDLESLLDDSGRIDMSKVDEHIEAVRKKFKLPQGFKVNRAQGQSGAAPVAKPSLSDAFRPR